MLSDLYDNPISTDSPEAEAAYVLGMERLLAAQPGIVAAFEAAVAADPGFALGHAGLARARQYDGDMPGARAAMAEATALGDRLGPREAGHLHAMGLLIAQSPQALAAVRAHVEEYPRDALVAQSATTVFGLIGFSGKPGREAETLAFNAHLLRHYGEDDWWVTSQYAFALCETGRLDLAEDYIDRSLVLKPDNAHGAHVRAHVSYEMGAAEAGRAYLDRWLEGYDRSGFLHGHLSWHAALWALEADDLETVWRLVDAAVTPPGATHSLPINVLTDTVSILHRAALKGVEVPPDRWAAISAYATRCFPKTGNAFIDIHAALAHAMAGDTDALRRIVEAPAGPAADMVPDLACASRHMAAQNWSAAAAHILKVVAQSERLGGSRAQRDLIEHSLAACLIRQDRAEEAQALLAARRPVLLH